ncbi:hypothetical protein PVAP13_8KG059632 [Panicum virgatum]|uniref:Uncharacterized protein n=1 Tax=Panicum virgatum TaxID=38727 RepID=A0A8T0PRF3_PANVG|nr:hypothetical protein PVAP13_8KG059632 [Panicum virgatum]
MAHYHPYPVVPCASSPLRLLELYVVAGGALNPAHLNDLEHGGMLLMFFLFGALALASHLSPSIAGHHQPRITRVFYCRGRDF